MEATGGRLVTLHGACIVGLGERKRAAAAAAVAAAAMTTTMGCTRVLLSWRRQNARDWRWRLGACVIETERERKGEGKREGKRGSKNTDMEMV
jgi:hypothetical protein